MEDWVKLIEAIAKLSRPLIFLGLLFFFRESIKSVIDSAKGRKFTLKVGGYEF